MAKKIDTYIQIEKNKKRDVSLELDWNYCTLSIDMDSYQFTEPQARKIIKAFEQFIKYRESLR